MTRRGRNAASALLVAVTWAFALVLPHPLAAQDFATRDGKPVSLPPHEGSGPVPVSLGVYLIQLSNLDQILQTFEIEGYLEASWDDPRLAFDAARFGAGVKVDHDDRALAKLGEQVWWPSLEFVNASGGGELYRHWLEVDSTGHVAYTARFHAVVTSAMDLRRFPFDTQLLQIPIESYFYDASQVTFRVNPASTGFDRTRSLPEWTYVDVSTRVAVNDYAQLGDFFGAYSRFTFLIEIRRQWGFYVWKIFLPLFLIVASSWTMFWIRDLGINVGIAFTIMLTVVAFNFSIADSLPKVPYLTFLDAVMVVSYISVFLALLVVMTAHYFEEKERERWEDRVWVFEKAGSRIKWTDFPIVVFDALQQGNLRRVLNGDRGIGTLVR